MNPEVAWGGRWEHPECGASGEAVWDDGDTASAGHDDCDLSTAVTWGAEWTCHSCGAGGDGQFDDDTTTYADHECDDEDEEVAA
ncbi:hypothetical protein AB0D13_23415 [Streptomyces sp. NPDC048430]|uniref:hypothetical protein n=1 Tax=Streptomyces sp. NPDC048430 TaxID=3155388 RepID=UPI0034287D45